MVCSVHAQASYGQLLSAPSYDDAAIFDQVDIQPSTSKSQKAEAREEAEPEKQRTTIVVDDPVKQSEQTIIPGVTGGYVTYRIATHSDHPSYTSKHYSERRRFRDVVVSQPCHSLPPYAPGLQGTQLSPHLP